MDDGASEIVATPGVVCWLEAGLEAPVRPMQPELDRIAESRRARAATGTTLLPVRFGCAAFFRAPLPSIFDFIHDCFINAIVLCRDREGLLSRWTFKGQGSKPEPIMLLRREAAGLLPPVFRGPPN